MASVSHLPARGKRPYRAQVRMNGFKTKVAYFSNPDEAKEWCTDIEREQQRLDKGMEPSRENLRRKTVADLLGLYRDKFTPRKASAATELGVIRNFLKRYGDRKLIAFTRHDAEEYKDYLEIEYRSPQHKQLKPRTVERTVSIFKHAWDIAEYKWRGFEGLTNPWRKVKPTEQFKKRTRRPTKEELERIFDACERCKGHYNLYAPIAIELGVETGMRLQEIFNLNWEDIHLERRRIHIRKSKMDYKKDVDGRWIVMTMGAAGLLATVHLAMAMKAGELKAGKLTPDRKGPLFPMSKELFKQVWTDILMRAGIPFQYRDYRIPGTQTIVSKDGVGLTFHDLRREAASRFKRCLFLDEIGMMLGHGDKTVTEIYLEYDTDDLTEIQNKLDKHELGGLTFEEHTAKMVAEVKQEHEQEGGGANVVKFKRGSPT